MEKNEGSCSILRSLKLNDIEKTLSEAYHQEGPGRPQRKPIGIFKALIIKRVKQIPSDRELYRRLWNDQALREVCDIEAAEKPYHPSQLTRFRNRVGVERLEKIMNTLLDELINNKVVRGKKVVFDATSSKPTASETSTITAKAARTQRQEWEETAKPTSLATNCT